MSEGPYYDLEKYLAKACSDTQAQVEAWQKLHNQTQSAYELTKTFNIERTHLPSSGELKAFNTNFETISAGQLINFASKLLTPTDVTAATGTSSLLLSSLQSNIAAYVDAKPYGVDFKLAKTESLLSAQQVPLEDRSAQLCRKLISYSRHYATMMDGVRQDLLNSTNPLCLSNAAKNLREVLTAFIHQVSPDDEITKWEDLESHNNRPTRKSRLNFFAYMRTAMRVWPQEWQDSIAGLIRELIDSFDRLSGFTHINEHNSSYLRDARLELDRFCDRFISFLDARERAPDVLIDKLEPIVCEALQECIDNDLVVSLEDTVSHVYGPQLDDARFTIDKTTREHVQFSGSFSMRATLQIGSDGDLRRGDGLEWEATKNGHFTGKADSTSLEVELDECSLDDEDEDSTDTLTEDDESFDEDTQSFDDDEESSAADEHENDIGRV